MALASRGAKCEFRWHLVDFFISTWFDWMFVIFSCEIYRKNSTFSSWGSNRSGYSVIKSAEPSDSDFIGADRFSGRFLLSSADFFFFFLFGFVLRCRRLICRRPLVESERAKVKFTCLGADWNNLNSCAFVAIYRLAYRNLRNLRFRLIFSFLCCLWSVACIFWFQLICWRFKWADLHIIVPLATNERVECHTVASVSDD